MSRVLSVFNLPLALWDPCGDSRLELEGEEYRVWFVQSLARVPQDLNLFVPQVSIAIIRVACLVPCLASLSSTSASVDNESNLG